MSWTLTAVRADGSTFSVTVRNPELGENDTYARRQAAVETDGGLIYVQDLGREDRAREVTWAWLTRCEKSDLLRFFRDATNYRARPFRLDVTDSAASVGISTGQGFSTGDGYNTGQLVAPTTATFARVYLDQSALQFQERRPERWALSARFRIMSSAPLS